MYSNAQRRTHIYDLQRFLRRIQQEQGHPSPLVPDGIFSPETALAIREFQQQQGLPVTGTADFTTWTRIFAQYIDLLTGDTLPTAVQFFPAGADVSLHTGSKGQSVLVLQLMLNTIAPHFTTLMPVTLTGEYDSATVDAVRHAQRTFLLPVTGITDRATWEAMALLHNSFFDKTPLLWQLAEEIK